MAAQVMGGQMGLEALLAQVRHFGLAPDSRRQRLHPTKRLPGKFRVASFEFQQRQLFC